MKSQVLHTVWCYISGETAGKFEIDHSWEWKGLIGERHQRPKWLGGKSSPWGIQTEQCGERGESRPFLLPANSLAEHEGKYIGHNRSKFLMSTSKPPRSRDSTVRSVNRWPHSMSRGRKETLACVTRPDDSTVPSKPLQFRNFFE